jgi:WD40 repeat protein
MTDDPDADLGNSAPAPDGLSMDAARPPDPLPGSGVAFSPDDTELASSSDDNTVRLWKIAPLARAGALGGPLTGHTDYALGVAFSPVGDNLASIGLDNAVHLWDLNVNDAISRICSATSGVLTPDAWQKYVPGAYSPPCS